MLSHLSIAPYNPDRDTDVGQLFVDYHFKDHQLKVMGVSKERMVRYLGKTLSNPNMQSICLRDKGRFVGLITLQSLPWMSEHFGLRMYAVPHLLARSDGPLDPVRLLRYVMEELHEVDFLDCRVAVDDIFCAHALEICDFRYVGTEIYMGRFLDSGNIPKSHPEFEIRPCTLHEQHRVLQIVGETHVHNRFMYDPFIHENAAKSLYKRLVSNCFKQHQFDVLVADSRGKIEGYIISKMNLAFSQETGVLSGSLDFIGVQPEFRNKGLGAALNQWALYHLAQKKVVFVGVRTLASNYAALATCYRTGFKVTSVNLHFHKWVRRPAVPLKVLPLYPQDRAVDEGLRHSASLGRYRGYY